MQIGKVESFGTAKWSSNKLPAIKRMVSVFAETENNVRKLGVEELFSDNNLKKNSTRDKLC